MTNNECCCLPENFSVTQRHEVTFLGNGLYHLTFLQESALMERKSRLKQKASSEVKLPL